MATETTTLKSVAITAKAYPRNGEISLALIPATVDNFRKMFGYENAGHV